MKKKTHSLRPPALEGRVEKGGRVEEEGQGVCSTPALRKKARGGMRRVDAVEEEGQSVLNTRVEEEGQGGMRRVDEEGQGDVR